MKIITSCSHSANRGKHVNVAKVNINKIMKIIIVIILFKSSDFSFLMLYRVFSCVTSLHVSCIALKIRKIIILIMKSRQTTEKCFGKYRHSLSLLIPLEYSIKIMLTLNLYLKTKTKHWSHRMAVVLHRKVCLLFCPTPVLSYTALKLVSCIIETCRFRVLWPSMMFSVSWCTFVQTSLCAEGRRFGIRYAVLETFEGRFKLRITFKMTH